MPANPSATVSIDLDNLWTYLRANGNPSWQQYPSFLDLVFPRIQKSIDDLGLLLTFFAIGKDLELQTHRDWIQRFSETNHEICNHTYDHPIDFHAADRGSVEQQITDAEARIVEATGKTPMGFRGPSFRLSKLILEVLVERGYTYDASNFPTFIGPFARLYHFSTSSLSTSEKKSMDGLFGQFRDGFKTLKPHFCDTVPRPLLEVPVSTCPIVRTPIHFTYINFLADYSEVAAVRYFNLAIDMLFKFKITPSLLLHATDFIGAEDPQCPKFLPGMKRTSAEKISLLEQLLEGVKDKYEFTLMGNFASVYSTSNKATRLS